MQDDCSGVATPACYIPHALLPLHYTGHLDVVQTPICLCHPNCTACHPLAATASSHLQAARNKSADVLATCQEQCLHDMMMFLLHSTQADSKSKKTGFGGNPAAAVLHSYSHTV